ncbi:hypothetical protein BGZ49_010408 [Haplosporangium sp. Z 27]|nr:hypothetical protein BGZ49_010408 [Haplosporangium sp. Z 27]
MNQPDILEAALPIISSVLGNSTVAGIMAIFNLALNTVTYTTSSFNKQASSFKNQNYDDYYGEGVFGQGPQLKQDGDQGPQFQSQLMSILATVFSTINSTFASLTGSKTPLMSYILVAVLSYVAFKIVYGIVSWIVRSVLNLIKLSIIIAIVTSVLWFIINITSSSESNDDGNAYGSGRQHRHQDPISQAIHSFQDKFRAEYQRQQQQHFH